jgi:hypothetical protein
MSSLDCKQLVLRPTSLERKLGDEWFYLYAFALHPVATPFERLAKYKSLGRALELL